MYGAYIFNIYSTDKIREAFPSGGRFFARHIGVGIEGDDKLFEALFHLNAKKLLCVRSLSLCSKFFKLEGRGEHQGHLIHRRKPS